MAIIYTYPIKATPILADTVIITDTESEDPENRTKQASIGSIKNTINVVDSIAATLPIQVSASTGDITISSRAYGGNLTTGHVPVGGSSTTFLRGDGTWVAPPSSISLTTLGTSGASTLIGTTLNIPQYSGGTPVGETGSVQFKNSTGNFSGNESLTYNGEGSLQIGASGEQKGIVTIFGTDGDSGVLKIGHEDETHQLSLGLSSSTMSASYSIDFPVASPGGSNKILESNSSGELSWISTPSNLIPGNGLEVVSGEISTDNLANGGIIYSGVSKELAIDVGQSAVSGVLSETNGGTGANNPATEFMLLIGNGDAYTESSATEKAMMLPVGGTDKRPTASSGNVGLIRYNSQTAEFEVMKETSAASGQYSWYKITGLTIISG